MRGVAEVAAHLRQVRALEGAGVEVHQRVARLDHALEQGVRDARGRAAARVAGEEAVEVALVGQIARGAPQAVHVRHGDADQHAGDVARHELLEHLAHDLDAVELVAVDARHEAERRPGRGAAHHEHRDVHGVAREGLAGPQREPAPVAGRHRLPEQLDEIPRHRRHGRRRTAGLDGRSGGIALRSRPRGEQQKQERRQAHERTYPHEPGRLAVRADAARRRLDAASRWTATPRRRRRTPRGRWEAPLCRRCRRSSRSASSGWIEAAAAREPLTFPEIRRGVRALSARYVESRGEDGGVAGALGGAGLRAAFTTYYAPLHFLTAFAAALSLPAAWRTGIERVIDLGAGTGAVGAALALAAGGAPVLALDRAAWALGEARRTFSALGVAGRTRRAELPAGVPSLRPGDLLSAGFVLNECRPEHARAPAATPRARARRRRPRARARAARAGRRPVVGRGRRGARTLRRRSRP